MAETPKQVMDAEARSNALIEQIRNPAPDGGTAAATEAGTSEQGQASGQPPAAPEQGVEYWRQRFQVLRGKYDAEVPQLHKQLKAEKARVAELEAKLADAERGNTEMSRVPDLDQFDPELIDMTRRVAAEAAREALKPIEEKFRPRHESQPPQDDHEAEKARFIDALSDLVDDWEAIDREAGWKTYLRQIEPDTGRPRQERLNRAVNEFDVVTTASIFAAYKRIRPPAPRASALESEIVPGFAGSSAPGATTAEQKIWTRADIRRFYSDVNSGRIRDQAQIQRTEKEIDTAVREGRVRMA